MNAFCVLQDIGVKFLVCVGLPPAASSAYIARACAQICGGESQVVQFAVRPCKGTSGQLTGSGGDESENPRAGSQRVPESGLLYLAARGQRT